MVLLDWIVQVLRRSDLGVRGQRYLLGQQTEHSVRRFQLCGLALALDAFRDRFHAQRTGETDNASDDRRRLLHLQGRYCFDVKRFHELGWHQLALMAHRSVREPTAADPHQRACLSGRIRDLQIARGIWPVAVAFPASHSRRRASSEARITFFAIATPTVEYFIRSLWFACEDFNDLPSRHLNAVGPRERLSPSG
jgi:hypothetical protein